MLPHGHSISIACIGSIQLMDSIVLANVLFIPNFHFNLLYVSSLTHQHSISINFSLVYSLGPLTGEDDWDG